MSNACTTQAGLGDAYVCGPDNRGHGLNWAITGPPGVHCGRFNLLSQGTRFRVTLDLSAEGQKAGASTVLAVFPFALCFRRRFGGWRLSPPLLMVNDSLGESNRLSWKTMAAGAPEP